MSAVVLDPSVIAREYRDEVRATVAGLAAAGRTPRIRGLISQTEGPAATYARYAQRAAEAVGAQMEVRHVERADAPAAIAEANLDDDIDGIFLYYPLVGRAEDRWMRELVDPRKDVEGMHSFWSRLLYENRRFVDDEGEQQAILPCTPLAILKLLEAAGLHERASSGPQSPPLEGVTACVINRSDIVGRPLSAMLANDGARVFSLDLTGTVVFEPAIGRRTHEMRDVEMERAEALAAADAVITGVPSADFERVRGDEIREGAICVNVAELPNFDDSALERASVFVPRVGPLTNQMAMRNLARLAAMRQRS